MQQRNEKVAEPSMEAILASIRKIISEDPAPAKTAVPAASGPAVAVAAAKPSAPLPPVAPVVPPVSPPNASEPPRVAPSRFSDMMRELAPSAIPVGASATVSYHDDLSDLVDSEVSPVVASPAPMAMPPVEVVPKPPNAEFGAMPEAAPAPRAPVGRPADRPADLGAFIPSTAEPIGMTSPRPSPLSIGADLRSFDSASDAREPRPSRSFDLGLPMPMRREPAPIAELLPQPEAAADPETVADPVEAAQNALGALAMGLASPQSSAPPAGQNAMTIAASPSSPATSESTAPVVERRSLDDSIVDMLRPMIKDWLDDHLPEMVGKALHQELNERRGKDS